MMPVKEINGNLNSTGLRIAVVVGRFNEAVTDRLLSAAIDALKRTGSKEEEITVVRVPGSFEIPVAARRLAASGHFDAVICLGCLIRGETPHFEYIASQVTRGIGQISVEFAIPVSFGVLTADSVEQAMNRAGLKYGNKGMEAALAAVEMADLFRKLSSSDE